MDDKPKESAWDSWADGKQSMDEAFDDYITAKKDCLTGLLRPLGVIFVVWLAIRGKEKP